LSDIRSEGGKIFYSPNDEFVINQRNCVRILNENGFKDIHHYTRLNLFWLFLHADKTIGRSDLYEFKESIQTLIELRRMGLEPAHDKGNYII
jgi:hypothetical protein